MAPSRLAEESVVDLTHLDGTSFVLNAERIETVESRPDTVITTIDGKHFVVRQSVSEVIAEVVRYQREVHQRPELIGLDSETSSRG